MIISCNIAYIKRKIVTTGLTNKELIYWPNKGRKGNQDSARDSAHRK
jgi:hypothetical protein